MPHLTPARPLLLAALLLASCAPDVLPSHPDSRGVPCLNLRASPDAASPTALDPLRFSGTLHAIPPTETSASLLERLGLLSTAHAFALTREETVAGATIELIEVDATGRAVATPASLPLKTTTDAQGRFCVRADRRASPGHQLLLVAHLPSSHGPELVLRQLALSPLDADINVSSEALVRLTLERHVWDTLTPERWLNARTVADTRVGHLSRALSEAMAQPARESGDTARWVGRVEEALKQDERLEEALGGVRRAASSPDAR